MSETQTENGGRRRYRTGYIRTRPVASGYELAWSEVFTKGPILYERIRSELEAKYPGQHVLIDIVSGEYEIDPDEVNAARRLNKRFPDVKPWTVKIADKGTASGA